MPSTAPSSLYEIITMSPKAVPATAHPHLMQAVKKSCDLLTVKPWMKYGTGMVTDSASMYVPFRPKSAVDPTVMANAMASPTRPKNKSCLYGTGL